MGGMRWLVAALLAATLVPPVPATGQSLTRRATTVEAIRAYPGFFHGEAVVLLGEVRRDDERMSLVTESGEITLVSREQVPEGPAEVRGVVYDIGRLGADDPRFVTLGLSPEAMREYADAWPRPGEEILLQVAGQIPPRPPAGADAPPLREVALAPERFAGRAISVVGQFRGRNLFGDLPAGPGVDRWDFVIRTIDAAIWVTGQRPRGRGFDLDASRRMDAGRWLRVTGRVQTGRGLTWIDATAVAASEDPGEEVVEIEIPAPPPEPLEVIFSSPRDGEANVPPGAPIRVQFSRDLDADSLEGHFQLAYVSADGAREPVAFTVSYTAANRGVALTPAEPLAPFRTVVVEVLDGVKAFDGTPATPFTLRFTTGGDQDQDGPIS